jgi:CubicO group peptidase (beta-lactamase class C family)
MAERSAGVPFHDLVAERVFAPAGMPGTGFPRSDEPAGDLAIGYLDEDGPRTNIFHLPVRGGGDGGAVSNAVDIRRLWVAMFEGRILPTERITEMVRPHSDAPDHEARYGLGFWLHETRDLVELHGYDAGVSFRSVHDPASNTSYTVISNTAEGAWPISERLDELMLG